MNPTVFQTRKGMRTISKRTICEVLRQVYDLCVINLHGTNPELLAELTPLLDEAFRMGARMNNKLVEYKYCIVNDCPDNADMEKIDALRQKRVSLTHS